MDFEPWKLINSALPKIEKWPTLGGGWVDRFSETFLFDGEKVFVGRLNCETAAGWETEDGEIVTHWTEFKKPHKPTIKRECLHAKTTEQKTGSVATVEFCVECGTNISIFTPRIEE